MEERKKSIRTALYCAAAALTMLGFSFAAVPLYEIFCRVTGYGGTPSRAAIETSARGGGGGEVMGVMTVRLDANISKDLPWRFHPKSERFQTKIGESAKAFYVAENLSGRALSGQAVFNVVPQRAAVYISKIQCFCFTRQTLQAGETADMPVVFTIDPEIKKDPETRHLRTITFSYTFYPDPSDS